jgi:hypothetical protein
VRLETALSKTDVGVLKSGSTVVVVEIGEIITVNALIPVGFVVAIEIFVLAKAFIFDREIDILGMVCGEILGTLMKD